MDEFVQKMLKHFGNEGLIIYSKANDFFTKNQITNEEALMLYDLIVGEMHPLSKNKFARNLLGCSLYYQTLKCPPAGETFFNYITTKLDINSPETSESLYEIYNIIEFEYKFNRSSKEGISFLFQYLMKFANFPKTLEVFLLFKLYSAYLYYFLGNLDSSLMETIEIVSYLHEEVKEENESYFIKYIKLRNKLFNLKLNSVSPGSDINEYCSLAGTVFNELKLTNKDISMKIGIIIFDIYLQKNNFVNCARVLDELNGIFKGELIEGEGIENGIDFYLAITSRMAACQTYLCNNQKLSSAIKKIDKALEFLSLSNKSSLILLYKFLLLLYRYNNGINALSKEESSSIIQNFKIQFLQNNNHFFFNNYMQLYTNLAVFGSQDEFARKAFNFVNDCVVKIERNELLDSRLLIPYIIGVYNKVSELLFEFLNCQNFQKQEKIRVIQRYTKQIIIFARNNNIYLSLFESPYIMNVFVKICFVDIAVHLNVGDLRNAQNKIEYFEKTICPTFQIYQRNNSLSSIGLILKLKGDISFKKQNFANAIESYEMAKNFFPKNDHRKACVLYNLGLCYCFRKNVKKGAEYLSLCLHNYYLMASEKNLSGLSRLDIGSFLQEKIAIVQNVISKLNQGEN